MPVGQVLRSGMSVISATQAPGRIGYPVQNTPPTGNIYAVTSGHRKIRELTGTAGTTGP